MTRRTVYGAVAAGAAALAAANQAAAADPDSLLELLKAGAAEKKGVTVYFNGGQVGMLVTNINSQYVEGRSQAQSRIVVRLSAIQAATMA